MSKSAICAMLLIVSFFCASCEDDEVIPDTNLALVTLEDGKSLIFGQWYVYEPGDFGSDHYYPAEISETGIHCEDDVSDLYPFQATEWTKVSTGIQADGYWRWDSDEQYPASLVFTKILSRKLYITIRGNQVYFTKDNNN